MEKTKGILLDADYENTGENSAIRVFVKTGSGIETFTDPNFHPYFFVTAKNPAESKRQLEKTVFQENTKISRITEEKKNGVVVLRLEFRKVEELTRVREEIKAVPGIIESFEYDIPFASRYLIDKKLEPMNGIEIGHENGEIKKTSVFDARETEFNLLCFDIETLSPGRFSDPKKDPVVMLSVAVPGKTTVFTYKPVKQDYVKKLSGEKELFEEFVKEVRENNPDIIVTYNGDLFDFPFMRDRAGVLRTKLAVNADGSEPKAKKKGIDSAVKLKGIQHLDAYQVLRLLNRFTVVDLVKFDLESVAETLFGKQKEKVKHDEINSIWAEGKGLERLANYNKEDAEVTLEIASRYLPLLVEMCKIVRRTLFDVSRGSASMLVEYLLMNKCSETNTLLRNRPKEDSVKQRMAQSFAGGYVKEPVSGLHERIAVLDFSSLHPTIMISHNISPETLDCEHKECKSNVSPNNHWFCRKQEGFLSSILKEIFERRMEIKNKLKKTEKKSSEYLLLDARQHALKILLNSVEYNEPIILKQGNRIFIEKIGRFVDKNLSNKKAIKNSEFGSPKNKTEVLSFDQKKVKFLPIKKTIRHKSPKQLFKVTLQSGRSITLTKDHGLFTLKTGRITEIKTNELKNGTPVIVPLKVPAIEKSIEYVNFLDLLTRLPKKETKELIVLIESKNFKKRKERETRYLTLNCLSKKHCFIRQLAKEIGRKERSVSDDIKKLEKEGLVKKINKVDEPQPQKKFYTITKKGRQKLSLEKILFKEFRYRQRKFVCYFNKLRKEIKHMGEKELEIIKFGSARGGHRINALCYDHHSFFKFLGYYLAEGHSRNQKNQKGGFSPSIVVTNYDQKILTDMQKCANKAFGLKSERLKKYIRVNAIAVYLVLKALGIGKKAGDKRIPSMVFSLPRKLKEIFLHGY